MTEIRKGMCPPARKANPPRPPSSLETNVNFRFRSGLAGDLAAALVTLLGTLGPLVLLAP